MKTLALIVTLLIYFVSNGQIKKTVKIINATNNKPIEGVYCSIIKNTDKHVSITQTDQNGVATFEIWTYNKGDKILKFMDSMGYRPDELWDDTTATYEIYIREDRFQKFQRPINVFDGKQETVKLQANPKFKKKKANLFYLDCSSIHFGSYVPKTPDSLLDLPDSIREKLTTHLIERLGMDFYSKLTLSGGQIVDLNRLYEVHINAKNYKWTPYSYYICFSFQDTAKGIGLYTAKIVLDRSGNVVKEIQLPDIKSNPAKANLLSLEEVRHIAKNNGFGDDLKGIQLGYNEKVGSVAWYFDKVTNDNGLSFGFKTLVVDAHSGKVIEVTGGSGIR